MYVKRHQEITIKILYNDSNTSLGGLQDKQVFKTSLIIKTLLPYTQDQNRSTKCSKRVLQTRAISLQLVINLLELLWPKIYSTIGYLLNQLLTHSIRQKTPLEYLQELIGLLDPKPLLRHIVLYNYRAYVYIKNRLKLNKLEPRAYIKYLVGYKSINIFYIQILNLKRVILIRDVIFDQIKKYTPNDNTSKVIEEVIKTIKLMTLDIYINNDNK